MPEAICTYVDAQYFDTSLPLIPAYPGTYALFLAAPEQLVLQIGRLGQVEFSPGAYLYLGSARGPGGLRARLAHHLRVAVKPHWHIDWLRQGAAVTAIFYSTRFGRLECAWSQAVLSMPGVFLPAAGFGASDCTSGCAAHLAGLLPSITPGDVEERLRCSALAMENRVK